MDPIGLCRPIGDALTDMPLLKFPRASIFLHPACIVTLTWSGVAVLYIAHFSRLLKFETKDVLHATLLIILPVLFMSAAWSIIRTRRFDDKYRVVLRRELPVRFLAKRLRQGLILWSVCAVIETIVSGGVPIVWIFTGSSKVNFDYGISSVHGMVNALLLALGVSYWALFLYTKNRRYLVFPCVALIWSLVLVSRGTLLVLLLEYVIVLLRLKRIKVATVAQLTAVLLSVMMLFGYIGDFRSGADAFKTLAEPTESYPSWMPSGILWTYIYVTTPLNNLMLTMQTRKPAYDVLLPATAATLFPTILRNAIYGEEAAKDAIRGELENQALTVSTAYVGPFEDMGDFGIIGFSLIAGLLCEIYWHKNGLWNIFVFSVFTQALFLSLFYNLLFSLPILGQLVWFYYFSKAPQRRTALPPRLAIPQST